MRKTSDVRRRTRPAEGRAVLRKMPLTNGQEVLTIEAVTPDEKPIHLESDEQLRAVASHARHRIIGVLREGPATITQVAARLGIAKGSSSYHVRVLERAGLIRVVETRKVRGVTERYYAMAAKGISLPEPGPGEPEILLRHALADIEAAPAGGQKLVALKHTRLSPEAWDEVAQRLEALFVELGEADDPGQAPATLSIAFFRPQDNRLAADPEADTDPDTDTSTDPQGGDR